MRKEGRPGRDPIQGRRPLAVLLLALAALAARAGDREADLHALAAPPEAERSVETLARYLAGEGSPARTEREKARAIFRWITDRVAYAPPGGGGGSPAEVLARREAVCFGYAGLFEALCTAAGLRCAVVEGFGKGRTYTVGDPAEGPPNHAWNAVFAEGRWNLVDCTWGAGRTEEGGRFVRRFDPFYFFTPPELFAGDHLPEDPRWQLLERPLSREAFEALPHVQSTFYALGLAWEGERAGPLRTSSGEAVVPVRVPPGAGLMARLLDREGRDLGQRVLLSRKGERVEVRALCPGQGRFVLRLLGRKGAGPDPFDWAADLLLVSEGTEGARRHYPFLYGEWVDLGCSLEEPLYDPLPAGKRVSFRLSAPGAAEVVVVSQDRWERLGPAPGGFAGTVKVKRGEVKVAALFPGRPGYTVLLRYEAGSASGPD
ncbi:MAG: transglutaminase domain-containing protein [Acidobacteriota bacterium]